MSTNKDYMCIAISFIDMKFYEDTNTIKKDKLLVPSFQNNSDDLELFQLEWGYKEYMSAYPLLERAMDKYVCMYVCIMHRKLFLIYSKDMISCFFRVWFGLGLFVLFFRFV